jgi:hypothetical protein
MFVSRGSRNIQDTVGIEVSKESLGQVNMVNADGEGHGPQVKPPGIGGEHLP